MSVVSFAQIDPEVKFGLSLGIWKIKRIYGHTRKTILFLHLIGLLFPREVFCVCFSRLFVSIEHVHICQHFTLAGNFCLSSTGNAFIGVEEAEDVQAITELDKVV